jgi:hypothetical protein
MSPLWRVDRKFCSKRQRVGQMSRASRELLGDLLQPVSRSFYLTLRVLPGAREFSPLVFPLEQLSFEP